LFVKGGCKSNIYIFSYKPSRIFFQKKIDLCCKFIVCVISYNSLSSDGENLKIKIDKTIVNHLKKNSTSYYNKWNLKVLHEII